MVTMMVWADRTAHAESWQCSYKGTWGSGDKISWRLLWDRPRESAPWKITGDYDDDSGHARVSGTCQAKLCDLDETYTSGDYAGKTYYWTAKYSDKKLSASATENTLIGTWGHDVRDRKSGGAWSSVGTCTLQGGGPDKPEAATVTPGFDKLWKASAADVVKWLGEPKSKSTVTEEGMTGDFVSDWKWPVRGLTLSMSSSSAKGPFLVSYVTIEAPSTTKTSRGISIGAARRDVEKAYKKELATEANKNATSADRVYVGEADRATIFLIAGGKVSRIILGANMVGGGDE